jgi:hypothetical protein
VTARNTAPSVAAATGVEHSSIHNDERPLADRYTDWVVEKAANKVADSAPLSITASTTPPAEQSKPRQHRDSVITAYTAADLRADPNFLQELVEAYRYVFGGAPWHEWKLCISCGTKYGRIEYQTLVSDNCVRCSAGPLVDFHAPTYVVERLFSELTMPGATPFLFVAEAPLPHGERRILGFTWGYGLSIEHVVPYVMNGYFADLPEDAARHAGATIMHGMWTESASGNATYISEVGVLEGSRGSTMLFAQMLEAMAEQQVALGYPTWVLWTSRQSRAYPLAMLLGGKALYNLSEAIEGDDRLLLSGDCSDFLAICDKYPGEKMVSYFIKEARNLKTGILTR